MTGRAVGSKRNLTGAETLGISWQVSYDTQMPEQGVRVIEILFKFAYRLNVVWSSPAWTLRG